MGRGGECEGLLEEAKTGEGVLRTEWLARVS